MPVKIAIFRLLLLRIGHFFFLSWEVLLTAKMSGSMTKEGFQVD
jgi:hypothetical protein